MSLLWSLLLLQTLFLAYLPLIMTITTSMSTITAHNPTKTPATAPASII